MSELNLNLVDAHDILQGTIHGSVAEACVAALSAEPETIAELGAALERYIKRIDDSWVFASFRRGVEVNTESWDAGVVIIDLTSRIVAAESSYFQPQPEGEITYHDGTQSTDVAVLYRLPDDWEFLNSLTQYEPSRDRRRHRLTDPPIEARTVLYGRPLLEFIITNVRQAVVNAKPERASQSGHPELLQRLATVDSPAQSTDDSFREMLAPEVTRIHASWLMTPRDDLRGESPREVMLAKRNLIDFDLHTRELQWSIQGEGPPCLKPEMFAYRFAGFGTHECVLYYDLVRHLILTALTLKHAAGEIEASVSRLEEIKRNWLENPHEDFGRAPANIIESERRRLPLALTRSEMIVDEDCYTCVMMASDPTMGPGFMHFDASHMDDEFAFSFLSTREEWDEENARREKFDSEFNRRWEERQQRLARGEAVEDEFNLDWVDSFND